VKFRIRTQGTAGSSYYSGYVESPSIKRNSIPNNVSGLKFTSPKSSEYSYGDMIQLSWDSVVGVDNTANNYEISVKYTENDVEGSWQILYSTINNSSTGYRLMKGDTVYEAISNNEKVKFRVRLRDVFGEWSSYSESTEITRYDITGVTIGINGKWVNCQIYYAQNGSWVEQSVSAGVNNAWVDADGVQ
jgi:hypothetical protein